MGTSAIVPQIDPTTGERIKASGSAPQIDPETGERVKAAAPTPPSPQGNPIQQQFDKLTEIQPHHMPTSAKDLGGEALKAVGNIGAGGIGLLTPLIHPVKTFQAAAQTEADPLGGLEQAKQGASHPLETAEQLTGGAAAAGGLGELGSMIPSKARAGAMLQDIRSQAANVPVPTSRTGPEIARFQELTQRGGKTVKPITQLAPRIQQNMVPNIGTKPLLFPEARDFYSNISDASKQSPLQTLMGRGLKPTMLRQVGNVREAFNSDLGDAASQVGRGEDFVKAMREYAQAAKLQKALKIGGAAAGAEGLRRTGLLGKVVSKVAGQ